MNPETITATVTDAWTALQPYLPIIATKAAEKAGSELPAAVGKMWRALKSKCDGKQSAKDALTDLLKDPQDSDLQAAFRVQIKKILEEDPTFAVQIRGFVENAGEQIDVSVRDGAVAIGDQAKAVGTRGVMIGDKAEGNIIITGDDNELSKDRS